jgi:hypothetical protein
VYPTIRQPALDERNVNVEDRFVWFCSPVFAKFVDWFVKTHVELVRRCIILPFFRFNRLDASMQCGGDERFVGQVQYFIILLYGYQQITESRNCKHFTTYTRASYTCHKPIQNIFTIWYLIFSSRSSLFPTSEGPHRYVYQNGDRLE